MLLRTLALCALLILPLTGAQVVEVTPLEVDTTLYFHPITVQDMPVNTQTPRYESNDLTRYGPASITLTCLHPYTGDVTGEGHGTGGTTSQTFHRYRAFSTPGPVEYDYKSEGGTPRVHPERGLGYDIPINASVTPVLHWFLSEDLGVPTTPDAPAALTNVIVRVVVREGEAISLDDKAYDTGAIVLDGATQPVTASAGQVTGPGSGQVTASKAGGRWVYDFAVPLAVHVASFNQSTGFNVRIDVFADNAACAEEGTVMPSTVDVIADPEHQPRIELRNGLPLRIDYAVALTDDESVALVWEVTSGWGNYDVDVANATMEVFGPVVVLVKHDFTIQRFREAYHHQQPVQQAWTIAAADLPDGRYTAVFTVPNLQHTATARAQISFFVEDGKVVDHAPREAPGLGLVLTVGFLVLAAALRRRA